MWMNEKNLMKTDAYQIPNSIFTGSVLNVLGILLANNHSLPYWSPTVWTWLVSLVTTPIKFYWIKLIQFWEYELNFRYTFLTMEDAVKSQQATKGVWASGDCWLPADSLWWSSRIEKNSFRKGRQSPNDNSPNWHKKKKLLFSETSLHLP